MSFIKNAIVCYQALAINLFGFAVRRPALVTGPLTFQNSESNNRTVMDILKDGFLLAAPKRKRSKAVNRERRNSYHIQEKTELVVCPKCGEMKLRHHICRECFKAGRIGGSRDY